MVTIYENEGSEIEVLNQNLYQNDSDETNVKDSIYQNENSENREVGYGNTKRKEESSSEDADDEEDGVYNTPHHKVSAALALNRAGKKVIAAKRIELSMRRTQQVSRPESDEENEYDLPDVSDDGSEVSKSFEKRYAKVSSKRTKNKCRKRYILACIFCIFICIVSGFTITLVLHLMNDPGA